MRIFLVLLLVACAFAEDYSEGEGEQLEYGPEHIDRGFTARRAVVKDDKYVGFKDMIYDVNVGKNFFNKEFGFFRAEVGGMFYFSFTVLATKKYLRVSLRVNGKPQVWAQAQGGYTSASNSATLFLKAGDVVYLYVETGALFEPKTSYRGYNTFTGHRLTFTNVEPIVPRSSGRAPSAAVKKDYDTGYRSVKW